MPTGSPDYGIIPQQSNETSNDDVLELASRLNALASVNRSGQQVISIAETICQFNNSWYSSSGTGYFQPSLKYACYNRHALLCTNSAGATDYIGVQFNHLPLASHQLGVSGYFMAGTFVSTLALNLLISVSNTVYKGSIKFNLATGAMSIINSGGTYDSLGTFSVPNYIGIPFLLKFTINFDTMHYGKLFYGAEQVLDISGHIAYQYAQTIADSTAVQAFITNNSAGSNTIYIQDIIVTINEAV